MNPEERPRDDLSGLCLRSDSFSFASILGQTSSRRLRILPAMTTPIRAIIFDMDGLMIDSETLYWAAGRTVAARYGKTVQNGTLGRMMGRKPIESMRVFATEVGLSADPAALLAERDSIVFEQLKQSVTPMPGLMDVLPAL